MRVQWEETRIPGVIKATEKRIPAGTLFQMHWHEALELEVIFSGEAEHIYNSEIYTLSAGNAYIVMHHDLHAFRAATDVRLVTVNFDLQSMEEGLSRALREGIYKQLCCRFEGDKARKIMACCQELVTESAAMEAFSEIKSRAILSEIIVEILRVSHRRSTEKLSLVQRAVEWTKLNYRKDLSLSILAQEFGVTANYLGRIFAREMGIPFSTYLRQLRLRYVCNMLRFSSLSVKEIAGMSGYAGTEYFFYSFKQQMGMPPGIYRELYRQNQEKETD